MATHDTRELLTRAHELLDQGDVSGGLRQIRFHAEQLAIPDLATLMRRAAESAGFDDLTEACDALAADLEDPVALYNFGYACIEHGVSYAAIPALADAVRRAPGVPVLRTELVSAYDAEERHTDAVDVLRGREASWFEHYLTAYHQLMAGRVDEAAAAFRALTAPDEERFTWAYGRLAAMNVRADVARTVTSLGHDDLRGWHFVLTGGYLTTLSPYGFSSGMTGRYAYLQDDYETCLAGLRLLAYVLEATGRAPRSVSAVPGDRSSAILACAAGDLLGLAVEGYDPEHADGSLLVAYDLGAVDVGTVAPLRRRAPGQVLYEHARCWTDAPVATADVCTLLHQMNAAPWGERLGNEGPTPADTRPEPDLASSVVGARTKPVGAGEDDMGPEGTPDGIPSPALRALVSATAGVWLDGGRDEAGTAGPVRSSRFL